MATKSNYQKPNALLGGLRFFLVIVRVGQFSNKHPGFSFAVAYAVPMFGSLRSPNASPDYTWGMVYLSGMTNY